MDFIESCRYRYQNAWKDPNSIISVIINDLEKRDYNKAESNLWLLYRDGYWYDNEIETDHVMFKQLKEAVKLKDQEMIREEILKIVKHLTDLDTDVVAERIKDTRREAIEVRKDCFRLIHVLAAYKLHDNDED